jgi:uncharacterized protein (TIGR03643 family)
MIYKDNPRVLDAIDIDRIIEMAWEDRTTFDAIELQFGVSESEVIKIMRNNLKKNSFLLWRKRAHQVSIKHREKRSDDVIRFKCRMQKTIAMNKISKR